MEIRFTVPVSPSSSANHAIRTKKSLRKLLAFTLTISGVRHRPPSLCGRISRVFPPLINPGNHITHGSHPSSKDEDPFRVSLFGPVARMQPMQRFSSEPGNLVFNRKTADL